MPAFNDDKGTVVLLSKGAIIDSFTYDEKMHFALINNVEGVSLERLNANKPTNNQGNFHSASSSVGYATPGYKNSQALLEGDEKETFTVLRSTISPDNDGIDDMLVIDYHLAQPG